MNCDNISATKVTTYKFCPFKYYLIYQLKIEMEKNFGAEQGSMIHEIFENLGRAKIVKEPQAINENNWPDFILKTYREKRIWTLDKKQGAKNCNKCSFCINNRCIIMDNSPEEFSGCPRHAYIDANEMVHKVIDDQGPNNPLNKKILDVERRFEIIIDGDQDKIPVVGYIDVVTEIDENIIEIIDYKTGTYTKSYQECVKDPQLLIYHLAARTIYPQYSTALVTINFLKEAPITMSFDNQSDNKTAKAIQYYWNAIRSDESPIPKAASLGGLRFDWQCKALCSPEVCQREYNKIQAGMKYE